MTHTRPMQRPKEQTHDEGSAASDMSRSARKHPGGSSAFDFLIWAHSDQMGGIEMACILYSGLKHVAPSLHVGLVVPRRRDTKGSEQGPKQVDDYFTHDSISADIIPVDNSFELGKDFGGVCPTATFQKLKDSGLSTRKGIDKFIDKHVKQLKSVQRNSTVLLSCGDPLGNAVAQRLGLKHYIVTDHLLTRSLRCILAGHPHFKSVQEALTHMESYETRATGAFLSPIEFAEQSYQTYFWEHGVACTPMKGLLYTPVSERLLPGVLPSYHQLKNAPKPLVLAFGGGGSVWKELLFRLQTEYQAESRRFSLLVTAHEWEGKSYRRTTKDGRPQFYLLTSECSKPVESQLVADPGRLMYWYPLCDLVVCRGGLVAQQVLAAAMGSDSQRCPQILFVQEPNHPQIEHQWQALNALGFARTSKRDTFMAKPFELIQEALAEPIPDLKVRLRVRYADKCVEDLALFLGGLVRHA